MPNYITRSAIVKTNEEGDRFPSAERVDRARLMV
jgi:hypothetical protein